MKLHFLPGLCISSFFSSFLTESSPGSMSRIRARGLCPGSARVTFSRFSVELSLQGHFHGIFDFRDTLTEPSVTKGVKTPVIYSESQLLICKWALPAFPGACPALTTTYPTLESDTKAAISVRLSLLGHSDGKTHFRDTFAGSRRCRIPRCRIPRCRLPLFFSSIFPLPVI